MARPKINSIRFIHDEMVENRMTESMPPVLYKYRSWADEKHKASLIDCVIWFGSPKSLNDLFDIRFSYVFDSNEVFTDEFYQQLRRMFPSITDLVSGTRDYEAALQIITIISRQTHSFGFKSGCAPSEKVVFMTKLDCSVRLQTQETNGCGHITEIPIKVIA